MSIRFSAALLALAGMFLISHAVLADDRAPKVDTTKPTAVVYPASAQRAGEEGTVILKVHVVESGNPVQVSMAKSSGFVDLDNAAIETVMNWHYVPAIRGGAIADDWALVQVVYKLPEGAQQAPAK
jgi:TonB family protein